MSGRASRFARKRWLAMEVIDLTEMLGLEARKQCINESEIFD
jgi:hypothetical protein